MEKPLTIEDQSKDSSIRTWMLVIGVIFIATNLRAPITAVGPVLSSIKDTLGLSNAMAGSITTIPLLAFAILSPLAPKIANKISSEVTVFLALLFLTLGIGLRIFPSPSLLFIGTAIIGLAIAICNVLLPSIIKQNFPLQLGVMTGIYGIFMNVFGAMASGISAPLANKIQYGWRGSLGFWGILSFVSLLIWSVQLIKRNKNTVALQAKPEVEQSIWRSPIAWKVTAFMGLQSLFFYTLMTWLPAIMADHGYSTNEAGWIVSLMQVAIIPMTFIIPVIAGKTQKQSMLALITGILFVIGSGGLLTGASFPVWIIILGIANGSAFGLSMMFFALRTTSSKQAAELSGMAQSIGYLLAAFGPSVFGGLHDVTGDWKAPLLLITVMSLFILLAGWGAGKGKISAK
ncbi:major facilitator superfamily protein [Fictibacillus macauensis ZFHKF-1]|uniref:Major facilitator superfamily protein n=1 Tax=Fictibacillus macauensis ZFHKF-1 TaxID=1196324 RepID=I8UHY5_9BACL|nr:MFS transporter [Fictibacillus macauensis]EIT86485.1 major facilitator superfamily protein [Fictibacillus macauensis ZFHKF-1]